MKKNIYRNFKMLLAGCALGVFSLSSMAQTPYVNQVIIVNGGAFEFSPPFSDYVTVASYKPEDSSYAVFDTIYTQSVQDVIIDSIYAYIAAGDSIIKYDLNTYERSGEIGFSEMRSLSIAGDHLFVGKWYGSAPFLHVYDKNNLNFLFSVAEVDQTVNGVIVIGDSAYVPYNIKGTIDQYPPYQVYNDTLGKIAVIDLENQIFVRDIELDTMGAGAGKIYADGTRIFVVCDESGAIVTYHTATGALTFSFEGASGGTGFANDNVYAGFGNGIGAYDVVSGSISDTVIVDAAFASSAFDEINDLFYITSPDYSSPGKAYIYNNNGAAVDSFDVGISPEAMAIDYRLAVDSVDNGLAGELTEKNTLVIYPNPAKERLHVHSLNKAIEEVLVYDMYGRVVVKKQYGNFDDRIFIDIKDITPGLYILVIKGEEGTISTRFIKN